VGSSSVRRRRLLRGLTDAGCPHCCSPARDAVLVSKKRTTKEAWDAIAATHIGSDRARKTTLQALRKEWENLAFKPGEDVDDFALRLNALQQKMVQFGDDTYDEERAVEKLFRCILEKYK
jgi:hypothetical protein